MGQKLSQQSAPCAAGAAAWQCRQWRQSSREAPPARHPVHRAALQHLQVPSCCAGPLTARQLLRYWGATSGQTLWVRCHPRYWRVLLLRATGLPPPAGTLRRRLAKQQGHRAASLAGLIQPHALTLPAHAGCHTPAYLELVSPLVEADLS